MTVELIRAVFGSRDYLVPCEYADRAADTVARSGANYRSMRREERGLVFTLELRDCGGLERILTESGIEYELLREHGLPFLIKKYRRRIGIPIGAVIFCLILFMSDKILWSFEVTGNESIPSEVILERLDALGCGVGTYIPSIDFDGLHAEYLLEYSDTAWIAVNVRGTHASVEVLETKLPETVTDDKLPHNLVAAQDAVIYSMEIHRGVPVVQVGDLVKKGELIASGMVDIKSGFLLAHARGEVKGTVERSISVEVPLEAVRFQPTGTEFSEKYFNIFGISLKFFANTEKLSENYDKIVYDRIDRESKLTFFGKVEVPVGISESVYIEYAEVPVTYTEEEARTEAYRILSERLRETAAEGDIIYRETDAFFDGAAYRIESKLTLLCDIAQEQPIYIDNSNNTQEK